MTCGRMEQIYVRLVRVEKRDHCTTALKTRRKKAIEMQGRVSLWDSERFDKQVEGVRDRLEGTADNSACECTVSSTLPLTQKEYARTVKRYFLC